MYKERRLNAVVYEYVEAMQVKVKVNPMCLWFGIYVYTSPSTSSEDTVLKP